MMANYTDREVASSIAWRALAPDGPKSFLWESFYRGLLAAHLESSGIPKILDLGAGIGWLPHFAAENINISIDAYDPSASMCKIARDLSKGEQRFRVFNVFTPEMWGCYSLVLANWVIPALHTLEAVDEFLIMAHRALCVGGSFVVVVNHPDFLHLPHRHYVAAAAKEIKDGEFHKTLLLDNGGNRILSVDDCYWSTTTIIAAAEGIGFEITARRDLYDPKPWQRAKNGELVPSYQVLELRTIEVN